MPHLLDAESLTQEGQGHLPLPRHKAGPGKLPTGWWEVEGPPVPSPSPC